MKAEEFLKNSNATGMAFNREAIVEVMTEYAKLKCKEQREICAKRYQEIPQYKNFEEKEINMIYIAKSQEPEL